MNSVTGSFETVWSIGRLSHRLMKTRLWQLKAVKAQLGKAKMLQFEVPCQYATMDWKQ